MFNILFVFFKNLLPISFPRPLITVNLSQCKKFHFNSSNCSRNDIFKEILSLLFDGSAKSLKSFYYLQSSQKLFFHFFLPKVNSKFFREEKLSNFFNHNSSDQSSTRFYFEKSESKTIHMEISAESLKLLFAMSL